MRFVQRRVEKKGLRPRVAASVIAVCWVIAIVVLGIVEHLIDRESFATIWDGMWWATQTVTTVGYGDIVPQQTGGQVVAAVLMILSLSFFAVITGAITSMFVTAAQARRGTEDPLAGGVAHLTTEIAALREQVARLEASRGRGPSG
jgi:voltage-gated potassium channel Kch